MIEQFTNIPCYLADFCKAPARAQCQTDTVLAIQKNFLARDTSYARSRTVFWKN